MMDIHFVFSPSLLSFPLSLLQSILTSELSRRDPCLGHCVWEHPVLPPLAAIWDPAPMSSSHLCFPSRSHPSTLDLGIPSDQLRKFQGLLVASCHDLSSWEQTKSLVYWDLRNGQKVIVCRDYRGTGHGGMGWVINLVLLRPLMV